MLIEIMRVIESVAPIVIIGLLFCGVFAMLKYSKGYENSFFNFKKDLKGAEEENNKIPKIEEDKTLLGLANRKSVFVHNNANHIFVCGTTGSGKTVALANFVKSGVDNNYPMLIIDGKGDIGKDSMLDIVTKMSGDKKVYVIDLNNPDTCDRYNPFKNTSADIIKDMLINMTHWTEEHYKYNTERYLQRLCGLLELAGVTVSLESLTKYLPTEQFIMLSKRLTQDNIITKDNHFANLELTKTSGDI